MEKKPYTPPTVTDHGSVVEKTKGTIGTSYEFMGWRSIIWAPPPSDEGKFKP